MFRIIELVHWHASYALPTHTHTSSAQASWLSAWLLSFTAEVCGYARLYSMVSISVRCWERGMVVQLRFQCVLRADDFWLYPRRTADSCSNLAPCIRSPKSFQKTQNSWHDARKQTAFKSTAALLALLFSPLTPFCFP